MFGRRFRFFGHGILLLVMVSTYLTFYSKSPTVEAPQIHYSVHDLPKSMYQKGQSMPIRAKIAFKLPLVKVSPRLYRYHPGSPNIAEHTFQVEFTEDIDLPHTPLILECTVVEFVVDNIWRVNGTPGYVRCIDASVSE
jgi:hypothetical protein